MHIERSKIKLRIFTNFIKNVTILDHKPLNNTATYIL